jgi:glutamate racemase
MSILPESRPETEGAKPIGVFDSGVGGLSVWREIVRQLSHESTIYLADQAHVPYGPRALNQVQALSEEITRFLLRRGCKIIVVACNTASAAALHNLRHTFPDIPFVGMEPAVKPAVERTRNGVVGVIATQATFQGTLFASLIERYGGDIRVLTQTCPGLVTAVENGVLDTPDTKRIIKCCLTPLIDAGIDQLVLGCTHYPFLRPVIEDILGPMVQVIDPAPAVARQVGRVLAQQGLTTDRGCAGRHTFHTTGDTGAFSRMIKRLLPIHAQAIDVQPIRWRRNRLGLILP